MSLLQCFHPSGEKEPKLAQWELIQHPLQNPPNVLRLQLRRIDRQHRHAVFFLQLAPQALCAVAVGCGGVQQNQKRLAQFLQLCNHPFLCLLIIFPRQLGHAPVRCHYHPYGGMVGNDLFRPQLRRFAKGHRILRPWRMYHSGAVPVHVALCPRHQIPHAVNHPHAHICIVSQGNFHRFIRHKFRLCRHDCPSACRLRQFVLRPLPRVGVCNVRQHQQIHKPLDKGRFPCSHRSHHADINVSARPLRNVLINIECFHAFSSVSFATVSIQCNLWKIKQEYANSFADSEKPLPSQGFQTVDKVVLRQQKGLGNKLFITLLRKAGFACRPFLGGK